mmetsp:Transcript_27035/g.84058  ORF Transcript_27035/g.84058 Transcript_27035/m.84058 type:complete len:265 (-) Transcript_27035:151-945(-)
MSIWLRTRRCSRAAPSSEVGRRAALPTPPRACPPGNASRASPVRAASSIRPHTSRSPRLRRQRRPTHTSRAAAWRRAAARAPRGRRPRRNVWTASPPGSTPRRRRRCRRPGPLLPRRPAAAGATRARRLDPSSRARPCVQQEAPGARASTNTVGASARVSRSRATRCRAPALNCSSRRRSASVRPRAPRRRRPPDVVALPIRRRAVAAPRRQSHHILKRGRLRLNRWNSRGRRPSPGRALPRRRPPRAPRLNTPSRGRPDRSEF